MDKLFSAFDRAFHAATVDGSTTFLGYGDPRWGDGLTYAEVRDAVLKWADESIRVLLVEGGVVISPPGEAVNHPDHYRGNGIEVIDVIEGFGLGFNLGNAVKYILRAGKKEDECQDLRKALWYIERELARKSPE
jgi:hypothetical protein